MVSSIRRRFSQKSSLKYLLYLQKCYHFKNNDDFWKTDDELIESEFF